MHYLCIIYDFLQCCKKNSKNLPSFWQKNFLRWLFNFYIHFTKPILVKNELFLKFRTVGVSGIDFQNWVAYNLSIKKHGVI